MTQEQEYLIQRMKDEHTHDTFMYVVSHTPFSVINKRVPNREYLFWHVAKHICISQRDIIDYLIGTNYKALEWPKEYWPNPNQKTTEKEWKQLIKDYQKNIDDMIDLIRNHYSLNVFKRTVMTIDHTSYHIGELSLASTALKNEN